MGAKGMVFQAWVHEQAAIKLAMVSYGTHADFLHCWFIDSI